MFAIPSSLPLICEASPLHKQLIELKLSAMIGLKEWQSGLDWVNFVCCFDGHVALVNEPPVSSLMVIVHCLVNWYVMDYLDWRLAEN